MLLIFYNVNEHELSSYLFRLGKRLCFMPPKTQSPKVTWKMSFDILSLKKALLSILLKRYSAVMVGTIFVQRFDFLEWKDTLIARMRFIFAFFGRHSANN